MSSLKSTLDCLIQRPLAKHTATVIFMHGLGDTSAGWNFLSKTLSRSLPHVKWILPNAPLRPVTINGGSKIPAWYDICSLDDSHSKQDEQGLDQSFKSIEEIIENENKEFGITKERVVVGGFSQGGAMSLVSLVRLKHKVGGFISLSGYLPPVDAFLKNIPNVNMNTPVFMGHGEMDIVVQFSYGERSKDALEKFGFTCIEFQKYPSMAHSACDEEVADVKKFLERVIG